MDLQAIIVAIGTEVTSGQSIDTNSAFLANRLGEPGISAISTYVVDDNQPRIAQALRDAANRAGVVIVSGGLGPTADDLTRAALADAMGVELVEDAGSLAYIEAFFRRRGRPMDPTNRVQALVPRGAAVLTNEVGTAPGLAARLGSAEVYVVPGVPSEMALDVAAPTPAPPGPTGRDGQAGFPQRALLRGRRERRSRPDRRPDGATPTPWSAPRWPTG